MRSPRSPIHLSSSGRQRSNHRVTPPQPSASGIGLLSRIGNGWTWLLNQRFHYAAVIFVLLWFLLWYRAFYIQIIKGPEYKEMAERQNSCSEKIDGERGNILDRNGHILARSVYCQSVYAKPSIMENIDDAAQRLAPILNRSVADLVAEFSKNKSFVYLKRQVDDATASAIEKEAIRGIGLLREYKRFYPHRHLAGQLLGFVGMDHYGLEGVEQAYDTILSGTPVTNRRPTNPTERFLARQTTRENQRGEDITLTIDMQIQSIAEDVLQEAVQRNKAKWGGVLVANARTGEILAWAQYPFFNPNNYRKSDPSLRRNRLAGDSMEPGSTFKPFLVASALEEKVIAPNTVIFCENGLWRLNNHSIRDDTHSFGNLTATEVISHSSNIGVAKIARMLGSQKFYTYLSKLNFGQSTGIGIHEAKGTLRQPKNWSELDLLTSAFGQGISATGLQMLQGYIILANNGEYKPLRLIHDREGYSSEVETSQRIFSKKTVSEIIKMMEEAVEGNGTGFRARIPGIRVAGKTGTAQKAAKNNKGYSDKRLASFGGIVPADDPQYVIYVMIDEPSTTSYASVVSAPVFQQVAVRTLAYSGYLPDVTFSQTKPAKKLTPAQVAQKKKDEIYRANLAKYRAAQEEKKLLAQKKQAVAEAHSGVMPNLKGLSLRRAMEVCSAIGIIPSAEDNGSFVIKQFPSPGSRIEEGVSCTVWLCDVPAS